MTENQESPAAQPRQESTAPGLEGEGGDAGTSGTAHGTDAVREVGTDGQVNTSTEERGPLHGDQDSDR